MHKIILDTSVYIPLLRSGKMPGGIVSAQGSLIYLSVIVAQELYAGAGDAHTIRVLDDLYDVFARHGRIVVPTENDWKVCGKILSQIGRKHGFESIKRGRLVNDVLIALSCGGEDAALITANHKDFKIIHEFVKFQFLGV
jgi:predicted nucleic acid-binding protein